MPSSTRGYIRKWLVIGTLIGIISGIGAIVFHELLDVSTKFFLGKGAGFVPPKPGTNPEEILNWHPPSNPYLIILILVIGGLLSGFLVYTFAPEAEGHGTDAAIRAFHRNNGKIRARIPVIKMIASAITIGTGGSAGREGPTAQISAGLGSLVADLLKLSPEDRRLAVAVGIGAGIGGIFKAPLGGAILGAEILYKRDIEAEAIVPALIASPIGYVIFCSYEGYEPIFNLPHVSFLPVHILFFILLGVIEGLVGLLYIAIFYRTHDAFSRLFKRLNAPQHIKPAVGAFFVGLVVLATMKLAGPEAGLGILGTGYGFLQMAMYNMLSWKVLLAIGLLKIVTTSLTIGSGGSGGVFAPGLVIGGMTGGVVGMTFHFLMPTLIPLDLIPAFVVVGMVALFGGISKAPIANIVMVSEMTNSYHFLVPAMAAVFASYLITGDHTIYREQVETKFDSPAHFHESVLAVLKALKVRDIAETTGLATVSPSDTLTKAAEVGLISRYGEIPVVDNGKLVGILLIEDVRKMNPSNWENIRVSQVMKDNVSTVKPDEPLTSALRKFLEENANSEVIPVVDKNGNLVGIITKHDLIRVLLKEL